MLLLVFLQLFAKVCCSGWIRSGDDIKNALAKRCLRICFNFIVFLQTHINEYLSKRYYVSIILTLLLIPSWARAIDPFLGPLPLEYLLVAAETQPARGCADATCQSPLPVAIWQKQLAHISIYHTQSANANLSICYINLSPSIYQLSWTAIYQLAICIIYLFV